MRRKNKDRLTPSAAPKPGSSDRGEEGLTLRILDLKQSHEALGEAEERYRRIFEDSKDMVYTTSADGKLADINQAGVDLFGYASKEEMMQVFARDTFEVSNEHKRKEDDSM